MNIFVLDEDPIEAARMACDKHVVKMILESLTMMSATFPDHIETPYKKSWKNHPCTKWVGESWGNWNWMTEYTLALCEEYRFRYHKIHKGEISADWCKLFGHIHLDLGGSERTEFVQAMPEDVKHQNPIIAYRQYYVKYKSHFVKYTQRDPPVWYPKFLL